LKCIYTITSEDKAETMELIDASLQVIFSPDNSPLKNMFHMMKIDVYYFSFVVIVSTNNYGNSSSSFKESGTL
jgi:hypothetical protein